MNRHQCVRPKGLSFCELNRLKPTLYYASHVFPFRPDEDIPPSRQPLWQWSDMLPYQMRTRQNMAIESGTQGMPPVRRLFMGKAKKLPLSRPPLERIFEFHNLIQAGKYPNCFTLARKFEVHVRTINRDLDFMRDRLDLPLEYNSQRRGYYHTRSVEHFPLVPMTEAEIFALLVAHKAIAQDQGARFEHPLQTAFRKLSGQCGTRYRRL